MTIEVTELTEKADEEGTYVITYEPTDNAGEEITPSAITWSLFDLNDNIINNKENVSISSPSTSNTIVLTGDDLALQGSDNSEESRIILFKALYDATIGGVAHVDLVAYKAARFKIAPVSGVS